MVSTILGEPVFRTNYEMTILNYSNIYRSPSADGDKNDGVVVNEEENSRNVAMSGYYDVESPSTSSSDCDSYTIELNDNVRNAISYQQTAELIYQGMLLGVLGSYGPPSPSPLLNPDMKKNDDDEKMCVDDDPIQPNVVPPPTLAADESVADAEDDDGDRRSPPPPLSPPAPAAHEVIPFRNRNDDNDDDNNEPIIEEAEEEVDVVNNNDDEDHVGELNQGQQPQQQEQNVVLDVDVSTSSGDDDDSSDTDVAMYENVTIFDPRPRLSAVKWVSLCSDRYGCSVQCKFLQNLYENHNSIINVIGVRLCDAIINYHNNDYLLCQVFRNVFEDYDIMMIDVALWLDHNVNYEYSRGRATNRTSIVQFLIKNTNCSPIQTLKCIESYSSGFELYYTYHDICMLQYNYGYEAEAPNNKVSEYFVEKLFHTLPIRFTPMCRLDLYLYNRIISQIVRSNLKTVHNENILHIFCKLLSQYVISDYLLTSIIDIIKSMYKDEQTVKDVIGNLTNQTNIMGETPLDVLVAGKTDIEEILLYIHAFTPYSLEVTDTMLCLMSSRWNTDRYLRVVGACVNSVGQSKILNHFHSPYYQNCKYSLFDILTSPYVGRLIIRNGNAVEYLQLKIIQLASIINSVKNVAYYHSLTTLYRQRRGGVSFHEIFVYYNLYSYCLETLENLSTLEKNTIPEMAFRIIHDTPTYNRFMKFVRKLFPKTALNKYNVFRRVLRILISKDDFTFTCDGCKAPLQFTKYPFRIMSCYNKSCKLRGEDARKQRRQQRRQQLRVRP